MQPLPTCVTVFDRQSVWIDIQKDQSLSERMLLLLKNYGSPHLDPLELIPLFHFLTHVFSSSPFFRLPQSLEFAGGQKAAAEAQPIWNAAPPFWRSERERRHQTGCKPRSHIHKLFTCTTNLMPALIYLTATGHRCQTPA